MEGLDALVREHAELERRMADPALHADAAAGRTVLFATHYLEEADAFADRIVMVAGGRVVADGPTEQLRATATGRTVSADLPPEGAAGALEVLRGIPDVVEASLQGSRVTVRGGDADEVALLLLRDLRARVGLVAARLLLELLEPDDVLGLPWSRMVHAMVEHLPELPPVEVVQLCGVAPGSGADASAVDVVVRAARRAQRAPGTRTASA